MAHRLVQQSRDTARQGGVVHKRVAWCNESWARRFVPGTEESGTTLPAETLQSSLTCPPGRSTWVARYRHAALQEQGKRPTRSKTWRDGSVCEHIAFQTGLSWLWSRHELVTSAHARPECVLRTLEKCDICARKEPCSFMSSLRKEWQTKICVPASGTRAVEDGSAGGEPDWSGEGTSATQSSEGEQQTATPASRKTTIQPTGLCALLVGDSNATGYCETTPWKCSLRKALGKTRNVTVAAKSGASFRALALNFHGQLRQWAPPRWKSSNFTTCSLSWGPTMCPRPEPPKMCGRRPREF